MVAEPDVDKLLNFILAKATDVLKAERSSLFMYNPDTKKLESKIAQKTDMKINVTVGEGIVGQTALDKKVIICPDTYNDPHFMKLVDKMTGYKTRNILSAPLITPEGELLGVIEVLNKIDGNFADYDISLIEAFASYATIAIQNALRRNEIQKLNEHLSDKLKTIEKELQIKYHYGNIIGQSPNMQKIYRLLDRAKETSFTVLIQGGSGTGKELVARAIHFSGPRADQKFLSQDCGTIAESLLEAEIFGYMKGAFTGADHEHKGLFALADKGTLFLDEIGNTSPEMQKKLLRVLQEGEFRPVGGKDVIRVDVRLIVASNQDLRELVRQGKFREDLFYRLNVIPIVLPPLKERKDDIQLLVDHFLTKISQETETPKKLIDKEVLKIFLAYDWPGNIRELENEIKKMMVLGGDSLTLEDVSPHIIDEVNRPRKNIQEPMPSSAVVTSPKNNSPTDSQILKDGKKEFEKHMILRALQEHNWNITDTAKALGMQRPNLSAKMKLLGITKPE
jgi:Nif-specific regulatory protein